MDIKNKMPAFNPRPNPSNLELCSPTALHITHCENATSEDAIKSITMENNIRPFRCIATNLHVARANHNVYNYTRGCNI